MQFILIAFFVIVALTFMGSGGSIPNPFSGLDITTRGTIERSTPPPSSIVPTRDVATSVNLETTIISGPKENAVVDEKTVTFTFGGSITPEQPGKRLSFETLVVGIDTTWQKTSGTKRTITLPAGPNEYVFSVRSKLEGKVDPTPAFRTFRTNTSAFLGKVRLSGVQTKTNPFSITLRTSLNKDETVNITGWRIEGITGGFPIRQGIEKFHAVKNTTLSDIILKRGDRVFLSGRAGPFGRNINFRPNLCFGYLLPYYTFPMRVPSSCPDKATLKEVSNLSPACQDFILQGVRTSSCTVPDHTTTPGVVSDSECIAFVQNRYNYDACYNLHSKEPGFDKTEWHVYLDRTFGNSRHDTIKLLDKDGLLVDQFIY